MTESTLMERNERLILGIDPGFGRMGYAVVAAAGDKLQLIFCDAIMTPKGLPYPLRLQQIYEQLNAIIIRYRPHEAAIEELFFGKNVTTAIPVAQARGVALLALAQSGLLIAEYTPNEVKLAVTGYGAARKEQVGAMVRHLLLLAPRYLGLMMLPMPLLLPSARHIRFVSSRRMLESRRHIVS